MTYRLLSVLLVALPLCIGCASLLEPYRAAEPAFHICSVKREDKLMAIDGQSRLLESKGINSQGTRNSGRFTGLGGLDKWRYEARLLPPELQGEEYVVVFTARGTERVFKEPLTVKFEYMYAEGLEAHYSEKTFENLPRGRHRYVWKNIGTQNTQHGDITGWRVSLHYRDREVDSRHSALWRPLGKVVLDE